MVILATVVLAGGSAITDSTFSPLPGMVLYFVRTFPESVCTSALASGRDATGATLKIREDGATETGAEILSAIAAHSRMHRPLEEALLR